MKIIKLVVIGVFLLILILPLVFFNFQSNYFSAADNRILEDNPLDHADAYDSAAELGDAVKSYVADRIGFRSEAMAAYNIINERLFSLMDHPYYMKGQDDYIFMRKYGNVVMSDYHRNFAKMVVELDRYCKQRGVPFLFVFEPEKLSVLREYAPIGMNYDDSWVDEFLAILDENGVSYVDNTEILTEKHREGEWVFNHQYDAGHWNDIGAFYGVNAILEKMGESCPGIHLNTEDEFVISEEHNVDLQQVGILVEETTPLYTPKTKPKKLTDLYKNELMLNEEHHYFNYFVNDTVASPRVLCFQGSYMNTRGYKFLANALNEYIAVHDYQNIFDFDYYFNIFDPEYVIFEVAEYTYQDMFFSADRLSDFALNPAENTFDGYIVEERTLSSLTVTEEDGKSLRVITVTGLPDSTDYAYAQVGGKRYDLHKVEGGYSLTLKKDDAKPLLSELIAVDTAAAKRYRCR